MQTLTTNERTKVAESKKISKKLVESFTFCKNKCIFVADFALIESEIGF